MLSPQNIINRVDQIQQRSSVASFVFAVIKRYGDDQVGYQAALLTYYAFLSLFPLLLVLTTLTQLLVSHDAQMQSNIIKSVTDYIPILGSQLSAHVHSLHKNGLALVIGLLLILYGARGVADIFQNGVQHIWHIPKADRGDYLHSMLVSFKIIVIGGLGLILASICAGLAASAGHGPLFRVLSLVVNVCLLFVVFSYLLRLCLPQTIAARERYIGAGVSATGLVVLQLLGGYLLIHVLKNLDALYSYFATTLGLMFWIYLQSQVVYYAMVISVVKSNNLWPRSLSGKLLTTADHRLLDHKK